MDIDEIKLMMKEAKIKRLYEDHYIDEDNIEQGHLIQTSKLFQELYQVFSAPFHQKRSFDHFGYSVLMDNLYMKWDDPDEYFNHLNVNDIRMIGRRLEGEVKKTYSADVADSDDGGMF